MPIKVLVAYSASTTFLQTTRDYLEAISRVTDYDVDYVHVTNGAIMDFDFRPYDVVFHNYCARLCVEGYVSESYRSAMRSFRGLKVLAIQDEYEDTNLARSAIVDLGFHVVLTCVPPASLDYVYPSREFSKVRFVYVFTGYAPAIRTSFPAQIRPLKERPIVLGYRGRDIGARYGRLALDKYEIGRRMKLMCAKRGIAHDIAMDAQSRIHGLAWFDFLGDCRAVLGTESGSNVFDFDGSIAKTYERLSASLGRPASYQELAAIEPIILSRESEISMGQIPPRVFEYAALRTAMVLFEGSYSGVIDPHEHYIPLRKDFTNADEVFDKLRNIEALELMTGRAYDHLIASGRFSYKAFWQRIGAVIAEEFERLPARNKINKVEPQIILDPEKAHLAEKTTRGLLDVSHLEELNTEGELNIWVPELQRLDHAFRDAIDRSVKFARHLLALLQDLVLEVRGVSETMSVRQRVDSLEKEAHQLLAEQTAKAARVETMFEEWRKTPTEALQKLRSLVDYHRQWATDYSNEYERFNAHYLNIGDELQREIAKAAREKEQLAQKRFVGALKARIRTVPAMTRLIRWLRGSSRAA